MVLNSGALTDTQWAQMERHINGRRSDPGRTGINNRAFVEAILWIVRENCSWRSLPEQFGNSNTIYWRFKRWSRLGVWWRAFAALENDPTFEYRIVDSTIIWLQQKPAWDTKSFRICPLTETTGFQTQPWRFSHVGLPQVQIVKELLPDTPPSASPPGWMDDLMKEPIIF